MAKDSLARGAQSAMFMGGTPEPGAAIDLAPGMVAVEDSPIRYECGICGETLEPCRHANPVPDAQPEPKSLEEIAAAYEPMNDRVLLRKVAAENARMVQLPDAFVQDSDIGIVISVGDGMLIGGELRPIRLKLGDKVRYGHYNAEEIEVFGETCILVSAFDVRLKIKA